MRGQGSTHRGVPAAMPLDTYSPESAIGVDSLIVHFLGEDGRASVFDVGSLPLPGWHRSIAASWAARIGPTGGLRTQASTLGAWGSLGRMIRLLASLPRAPKTPADLTVEHVDAYRRFREASIGSRQAAVELRTNAILFEAPPLRGLISLEVRDRMRPRVQGLANSQPGYSDGEFARIVSAARADVMNLHKRLEAGHREAATQVGSIPSRMLRSGRVPPEALSNVRAGELVRAREQVARDVFVTSRDITSMLVLLVATTGWNVEVVKDLPNQFRVLEAKAVELQVTKRRRGASRWHSTVTWEIGPPEMQLRTPGGLFLLLHKLMEPARAHLKEPAFWATWHNSGRSGPDGCGNPFSRRLSGVVVPNEWIREREIYADDPAATSGPVDSPHGEARLLGLSFNRLKTSVDVRRTRALGGHLPSSARTNTVPVLFRNYLAGDKTTIEWAREIMAETVLDVEQAAWATHRAALAASGRQQLAVVRGDSNRGSMTAGQENSTEDTPWAGCTDYEHHPSSGRRCTVSFLDCFHCGNCLVTDEHLPRLLSLLDALESRRPRMSDEAWWRRYGATWTAIRHDVLPNFTPAEIEDARRNSPDDSFLDIVEPRWEQP